MVKASTSFQRYLEEFQTLSRQVEQCIHNHHQKQQQQQQQPQHQDRRRTNINDDGEQEEGAEELIRQCDELLQLMTVEARSVDVSSILSKADMLDQMNACKLRLQILKDQSERQSLFSGTNQQRHRDRLQQQQDQVISQNLQLENAKRTLVETEEIANSISIELLRNRNTITSSQNKIQNVSSMTNQASKLIKSMKSWF